MKIKKQYTIEVTFLEGISPDPMQLMDCVRTDIQACIEIGLEGSPAEILPGVESVIVL